MAASPAARKAAVSAFVGSTIEWYDFYAYVTASSIVFGELFFPQGADPLVATMASFATYAVGFFVRPLGGILFGHAGDRVGRKGVLVVTLVLMGAATVGIGLLPTYGQIGMLAPALLVILRLAQGLAVGGEWGGAVLVAVEHAPERRRTLFGSFAQLGSSAGALLSTGAFSLMSSFGHESLVAWGWRVPFLVSVVLVVVGLLIRLRLEESPVMVRMHQQQDVAKVPVLETLRTSWRPVLLGLGALAIGIGGYYVVTSFVLTYGTVELGLAETMLLNGLTIAAVVEFLVTPWLSLLGDRVGARKVVAAGLVGVIVVAAPQFGVLATGTTVVIYLVMAAMRFAMSATYGPIAAILAQSFTDRVRYTGISLAYQGCGMLFGGLSPLIATALLSWAGGSPWPVVGYLVAMAALGIGCVLRLSRYRVPVQGATPASTAALNSDGAGHER